MANVFASPTQNTLNEDYLPQAPLTPEMQIKLDIYNQTQGRIDNVYDMVPGIGDWKAGERAKDAAGIKLTPNLMGGATASMKDPYTFAFESATMVPLMGDIALAAKAGGSALVPLLTMMSRQRAGWVDDAVKGMGRQSDDITGGIAQALKGQRGSIGSYSKGAKGYAKYMQNRTWDTEEEARAYLTKKIASDNTTGFGKTDPSIVDEFVFAKRGKQVGIKQPAQRRAAPNITSDPIEGASMPDVDFNVKDNADYGGTREGYIDIDSLPKAKLAGGKTGYAWDEFQQGSGSFPAPTIKLNKNGTVSILDGNHRIEYWRDSGFEQIPVKIVDDIAKQADSLPMDEASRMALPDKPPKGHIRMYRGVNPDRVALRGTEDAVSNPITNAADGGIGRWYTTDYDEAVDYANWDYDGAGELGPNRAILAVDVPEDKALEFARDGSRISVDEADFLSGGRAETLLDEDFASKSVLYEGDNIIAGKDAAHLADTTAEAAELEAKLWGGEPFKGTKWRPRGRYNTLRKKAGLPEIRDWGALPEELLSK